VALVLDPERRPEPVPEPESVPRPESGVELEPVRWVALWSGCVAESELALAPELNPAPELEPALP
jgi:hypothetical protein